MVRSGVLVGTAGSDIVGQNMHRPYLCDSWQELQKRPKFPFLVSARPGFHVLVIRKSGRGTIAQRRTIDKVVNVLLFRHRRRLLLRRRADARGILLRQDCHIVLLPCDAFPFSRAPDNPSNRHQRNREFELDKLQIYFHRNFHH